jgi:hypothetical protein
LRFAHEGGTEQRDAAKDFFPHLQVFDANNLLHAHLRGEQDQRAVIVDDDGVRLFRDGMLVGVLKTHHDRDADAQAFAAPAILRQEVRWDRDGHRNNLATPGAILKDSWAGCALRDIAKGVNLGARMPFDSAPCRGGIGRAG